MQKATSTKEARGCHMCCNTYEKDLSTKSERDGEAQTMYQTAHCNTLQRTATHCNICNTLQHRGVSRASDTNMPGNSLQHTQHTATHCNAYEGGVFHESASDPAYTMYSKQNKHNVDVNI